MADTNVFSTDTELTAVDTKVNTAITDIATNKTNIATNKTNIEAVKKSIKDLDSTYASSTKEVTLSTSTSDYGEISTEIDTLKEDLADVEEEILPLTHEKTQTFTAATYNVWDYKLYGGKTYRITCTSNTTSAAIILCKTDNSKLKTVYRGQTVDYAYTGDTISTKVYCNTANVTVTIVELGTVKQVVETDVPTFNAGIEANTDNLLQSWEFESRNNNWLNLDAFDSNNISDFIPVKEGEVLHSCAYTSKEPGVLPCGGTLANNQFRYVYFYNERKEKISTSSAWVNDVEIPEGCWFVKVDYGVSVSGKTYMVQKNSNTNYFYPYTEPGIKIHPSCVMPEKVYITAGQELNIYWYNSCYGNSERISRFWTKGISAEYESFKTRFIWKPTTAAQNTVTIHLYEDSTRQPVEVKTVNFICSESHTSATPKVMIIGDSKIDSGYPSQYLKQIFGGTATMLGTRGSGENKHEGRSGWSTSNYCNDSVVGGVSNPFYNASYTESTYGTHFDFSTYMSNQGYSGVDFVFIMLGTNDNTLNGNINNIHGMINSIHEYDSNVKVIIGLNEGVYSDKMEWFDRNQFFPYQNQLKIDAFDGTMDNVYVLGYYLSLDLENDYDLTDVPLSQADEAVGTGKIRKYTADGIHQNKVGYYKMAQCMVGILDYLLG